MVFRITVLFVVIAGWIFCPTVRAEGIKEGKWSMTAVSQVEASGAQAEEMAKAKKALEAMPPEEREKIGGVQESLGLKWKTDGMGGMSTSGEACITGQNPLPALQNCSETHEVNGNKVTFHLVCQENGVDADVNGEMTYTGDSMTGNARTHQVSGSRSVDTTIEITGKYVGPCAK